MKANTSLVVGSTGLVGETLLEELCAKGNKEKAFAWLKDKLQKYIY